MSLSAISDLHSALERVCNVDVSIVGPRSRFLSPMTRHLYEWWTKAGGGAVPLRRQFDITEHGAIAANIFLVHMLPDGGFEFRLHGENVICMLGENQAGTRVASNALGNYGHELEDYYRGIVNERVCKLCTGSLDFADRPYWRFESIDCPLSSDGVRADYIIGVMTIIE
jgi:hypothetical protein